MEAASPMASIAVLATRARRLGRIVPWIAPWIAYVLLFTAQQAAAFRAHGAPVPWTRLAVEVSVEAMLWALLCPLLARAFRPRPEPGPSRMGRACLLGVLILAAELLLSGLLRRSLPWIPRRSSLVDDLALSAVDAFPYGVLMVAMLVAIFASLTLLRESRVRELRSAHLAAETTEAQLAVLATQLQPHFLFNTLSTVTNVLRADPDRAERLLVELGDLLRRSLRQTRTPLVSLRDELEILGLYLSIQRTRYGERLAVTLPSGNALDDASVPVFVLQPLVENAIRHGLEPTAAPLQIAIEIEVRGSQLKLRVLDDGPGIEPDALERAAARGGIGLKNLRERLALLYGRDGTVKVTNRDEGGAQVEIVLPLRQREG